MPAPPSKTLGFLHIASKSERQLHTFEGWAHPGRFGPPPLGSLKTYQKPMVFHPFGSVPLILPRRQCDSRFCPLGPSSGHLQKCIQYYVFDTFCSWGPLGVIWDPAWRPLGPFCRLYEPLQGPQETPLAPHGPHNLYFFIGFTRGGVRT